MPVSPVKIFSQLLFAGICALWLMQQPTEQYWQQIYHRPSPLAVLQKYPWWRYGNRLKQQLNALLNPSAAVIHSPKTDINPSVSSLTPSAPVTALVAPGTTKNQPPAVRSVPPVQDKKIPQTSKTARFGAQKNILQILALLRQYRDIPKHATPSSPVERMPSAPVLHRHDWVLFAGDSMMQSLAPHIQRQLLQHDIKSINLGKPSTGLRSPDYFNWPETINHTLDKYPDIRLVIILLGANDPWDIDDPVHKGQLLHFQTPAWEAYYRGEISKIFAGAAKHNVQVLWIGPPVMRARKYSEKIVYLDSLIADETAKYLQYYQDTLQHFSDENEHYSKYIQDESGKKIAVRRTDGIHFNPAGEKMLARLIIKRLDLQP